LADLRFEAGVFLLVSAVLNMLARMGIVVDVVVSAFLAIGGVCVLAAERWEPRTVFGAACTVIGIGYSPVKLAVFYYVLPGLLGVDAFTLFLLGSAFLVPMLILCVVSLLLLLRYRRSYYESFKVEISDPLERRLISILGGRRLGFRELAERLGVGEEELRSLLQRVGGLVELDYRKRYVLTDAGRAAYLRLKKE